MTPVIYVPCDAAALAVGADQVAATLISELGARGIKAKIVRNGSHGMHWLEPLVEIDNGKGRIAYGPVKPSDISELLDAGFMEGETIRFVTGKLKRCRF